MRVSFEVWPEAIELGRLFADEGYELALVGGPVRDMLLHRRSHDLDFCTSARPEQFEPILRRWGRDGFWDMGRKFGTLGAMRRRADGTEYTEHYNKLLLATGSCPAAPELPGTFGKNVFCRASGFSPANTFDV